MSDNIYHSWSAYGEKSGFCELNRNLSPTSAANMFAHNMGSSRIVDSEDGSVPIVSIDSLDLLDVDAIQLDVEGFELPVIRGALKTIETYWPVISVETCVPGLKKLLWKLGYREVAHNVEFNGDKVFVKTEEKRHVIG